MLPPYSRLIATWPLAINSTLSKTEKIVPQHLFMRDAYRKLKSIANLYGLLLMECVSDWHEWVTCLSSLALKLSVDVFSVHGEETATLFVLAMIADYGYTLDPSLQPSEFKDQLEDIIYRRDLMKLIQLLSTAYEAPVTRETVPTFSTSVTALEDTAVLLYESPSVRS